MNIFVMNQKFETVYILDSYESFIWTDRYWAYGDFEIYTFFDPKLLEVFQQDYYISIMESDHVMIIEGTNVESDAEDGSKLRITGRSLESILERRIVWGSQLEYSGNMNAVFKQLITETIINPTIEDRKIDNFIYEDTEEQEILDIELMAEYTGDNIYEIINRLCETNKVGFKITLNDQNQFVFKLYLGTDRSYNQETNPYVVFSPKYENIINSNYIDSTETLRNVGLVMGEDSGSSRRTLVIGTETGLLRRELYIDARDIQSDKVSDYNAALKQRGLEQLAENTRTIAFDGEVETTKMFVYGSSFFMGDIIQMVNEYGIAGPARIIEFIHSESASGVQKYPTFEAIQDFDTDSEITDEQEES